MTARMRAAGWKIWRIDAPMTEHDAKILTLRQWWQRTQRGGYGYAQAWEATKGLPQRLYGRNLRSAFVWAVALPLMSSPSRSSCEGPARPPRAPVPLRTSVPPHRQQREPRPHAVDRRGSAAPRQNSPKHLALLAISSAAAREPFPSIKRMAEAEAQTLEMRLAYLTSQYPATSHTFISREVAAVREAGVPLETFSIRPATQDELQDEVLRKEAEDTFTVLREPLTSFLVAQIAAPFHPARQLFPHLGNEH